MDDSEDSVKIKSVLFFFSDSNDDDQIVNNVNNTGIFIL